MSDPWKDMRVRSWTDERRFKDQGGHGGHIRVHKDFIRLLSDADALLAVVRELGDGGDLEYAADLLQEATNEHNVNQTFDNNPYDLSDRLRLFAEVLAALPEHLK